MVFGIEINLIMKDWVLIEFLKENNSVIKDKLLAEFEIRVSQLWKISILKVLNLIYNKRVINSYRYKLWVQIHRVC